MSKQRQEWIFLSVGIFVIFTILSLIFLVFQVSAWSVDHSKKSYEVMANFNNIGGLRVHAPVTISGVKVGEVSRILLEPSALNAQVTLKLDRSKKIPFDDVSARILTEGLLGANYISILPGFDDPKNTHNYLQAGDVIAKTQDAVILENLIGQLLFNANK
jgi:phospholipid/cholesterol/gamma-HCH transport system substrate-binding protein